MNLLVQKLSPTAKTPTYGSESAAGMDLYANLGFGEEVTLYPGQRRLFPTGLSVAVGDGYYMRIAPRSGLAHKNGIDVLAGVVDSDYRGEVGVILLNTGNAEVTIRHGDRIAQGIIEACYRVKIEEVSTLPDTERGEGGFGSTGS